MDTPNTNATFSLPLSTAYAQWQDNSEREFWVVYDKDGTRLGELPSTLNEKEVMKFIRFGREHELSAFNVGIQFGKQEANKVGTVILQQRDEQMAALRAENERLATQLFEYISGETE